MAKRNSSTRAALDWSLKRKKESPDLSNFRNNKKNRKNEERIGGCTGVARGCRKVRLWLDNNTTTRQNRSDEKNNNNGRNSDRLEMTFSQWHV
jgi:hypothetical protein